VGQPLLFCLIGLHLSAIIFYTTVKKQDLLIAMIRGYKALPTAVPDSLDHVRSRVAGLGLLVGVVACALWVFS
jgi:hypothetical protein